MGGCRHFDIREQQVLIRLLTAVGVFLSTKTVVALVELLGILTRKFSDERLSVQEVVFA